jgi:hypothetical protein
MWEATAILVIVAALGFWVNSLRARERALAAGRAACARYGVQLLDETVVASALRLARDREGRLRIRRVFAFEFSDTGNNRRHGSVVILGAEVQDLHLEPYPVQ